MWWLLFACASDLVRPSGAPPSALPAGVAWDKVEPLDGVERLFTGPFRCELPDGTDASFFPNGVLRGEPDLRGNWTHAGRVLSGEARWRGVDGPYAWPYTPYTRGGAWLLASPAGVIACRPGHDRAASGGGSWVRVRLAGGDPTLVGRALAGRDELALVVLDSPADPVDGIVLVYAGEDAPRGLAQALADALQLPVRLAAEPIDAPVEVRVGR